MKTLRKPVFLAAGAYSVSLGTGRSEFHPRKPRPGLEQYVKDVGGAVLAQIPDASLVDEGVIANFMAARFNRQGNLAGLMPTIHPSFLYKPFVRVEGACGSGGLGLATGIKTVLAETADVVMVLGVEVQNTVKAVYGADILAGAGHYASQRKNGHAFFFPGCFSDRAGAYAARYGAEKTRAAMARWFVNAIENARRNPLAQEYQNKAGDLMALGMTPPNPAGFTDHLNLYDCSKVSDGAAAILVCSEEGIKKLGLRREDVCEVAGLGQAEGDLTALPPDQTELTTSKAAATKALAMAGMAARDIGVFEVHDCFTITGVLSVEALGLAAPGEGADLVSAGATAANGAHPMNLGGGLVGFGHPTGASGVRQAVDLWKHLTGRAGDMQVTPRKDTGMLISMGGNDKSVVSLVVRR